MQWNGKKELSPVLPPPFASNCLTSFLPFHFPSIHSPFTIHRLETTEQPTTDNRPNEKQTKQTRRKYFHLQKQFILFLHISMLNPQSCTLQSVQTILKFCSTHSTPISTQGKFQLRLKLKTLLCFCLLNNQLYIIVQFQS